MDQYKARYSFNSNHGKAILAIVAGTMAFSYFNILGARKEAGDKLSNKAIHKPVGGTGTYKNTDALGVNVRPAKNADTKGSKPLAAGRW